ncbi:ribonuclease R [Lapidilactobacillus gannanensis]|jgi:ribonuclease R|uniref:Ribonuclease R n=1 Tax=Lapidilactobacillus gannanensis TaxID=2486002 RepID=A0ABW4BNK8_9LACO|nr:ribonuclease R [Lapidilactobacillus gannanensis]MCH4056586.1 ribonuclease R [Lactobacillaceae bacterium]
MKNDDYLTAEVLEVFRANPNRKYAVQDINDILKLNGANSFKRVVRILATLEGENAISVNEGGRFKLTPTSEEVTGRFAANDKGFGFVRIEADPDSKEEIPDVFVPKQKTAHALQGDTVKVKLVKAANPWNGRGPEGEVEEIVEHGLTQLVGEFVPYSDQQIKKTNLLGSVRSHDKKFAAYPVYIRDTGIHPQAGDMVQVEITEYPSDAFPTRMLGIAMATLGNKNDPGVDIMTIVYQHGIRTEFPEDVLAQSEQIPDELLPQDWANRRDITDQQVVTIDGDDSKDFDDAVTVWQLPNGHYHLGVHIADVSHYVTEDSPLDKEAYARGTSTYLTDRVLPMLPFRLSNGICSLNPNENRLALTCDMEIDDQGQVVKHEIYPSVIRSKARLTYNNVNKILTDHDPQLTAEYEHLVPMLTQMAALHKILFDKRHRRGAIDFEETEAQIKVDEKGWPIDIVLRDRGLSERMIESFMLAANETVAEHFSREHVPFLYRVHETPDAEKVKSFFEFVSAFGIVGHGKADNIKPIELQQALAKVAGTPEEMVVTTMLLRSMKQAHYSTEQLGHFGIGADYYTHFTSPIRRYPDLIVHRLIHSYATVGKTEANQEKWTEKLPDIATYTSEQERRSIDTERDVDDLKKAQYMMSKVGQEFNGVIASVLKFGMFVSLDNTVEGLIHISNLRDDYYDYDEKQMTLTGAKTHTIFKIGQEIKIKVLRADPDQGQIDFIIAGQDTPADFTDQKSSTAPKKTNSQPRHNNKYERHNNNGNSNGRRPQKNRR